MKNFILLSLFITVLITSYAQDIKDFKIDISITMFGVDYSKAYFVGKLGFNNPSAIEGEYFNKWNYLFQIEKKKYSIEKFMKKQSVIYSTKYVNEINDNVTTEEIVQKIVDDLTSENLFSLEDAKNIALSYNLSCETKFGIIFFAYEYNKLKGFGKYHAIIVDTKSNTVVYATTIAGKVGGFGFRNFWATTFYNSLKQFKKKLKKL